MDNILFQFNEICQTVRKTTQGDSDQLVKPNEKMAGIYWQTNHIRTEPCLIDALDYEFPF